MAGLETVSRSLQPTAQHRRGGGCLHALVSGAALGSLLAESDVLEVGLWFEIAASFKVCSI